MSKVSKTSGKNLVFLVSESSSQTPEGMDVMSACLWNPRLHHTWRVGVISSAAVHDVPVWVRPGRARDASAGCAAPRASWAGISDLLDQAGLNHPCELQPDSRGRILAGPTGCAGALGTGKQGRRELEVTGHLLLKHFLILHNVYYV